ncbi:MAG: spiro-SPASM protein [Spirochaetaceae bacterium]
MSTGICVNAMRLSRFALEELGSGKSALHYVAAFVSAAAGALGGAGSGPEEAAPEIHVLVGPDSDTVHLPERWRRTAVEGSDEVAFVDALARVSGDLDRVLYVQADTPFLDVDAAERVLNLHRDYFAQFTGADGYPLGCVPEVFDGDFPKQIRRLAKEGEPAPRELFPVVLRDVNAFDVETMIATTDARPLRLDFSCNSRAGLELCRRYHDYLGTPADELAAAVVATQERLRILPAYASVQVVAAHPQRVGYLPQERVNVAAGATGPTGEMPLDRFTALVDELERFSPGIVVQVSLWGEVGLHSAVAELIADMEARRDSSLLLETSGVGWDAGARRTLMETPLARSRVIVDLDAATEEVYRELRGEGFQEAKGFAAELLEAHRDRAYVRATRMKENAADVERFYREWKERTDNVIVQKYDHFCGALPDRRLVDISPVERTPCWHLKRDIYVLLDGSVPMCREDLDREHLRGNLFDDGVEEVWRANEEAYQAHVRGEYPGICRNCDEYYTFNF